jgi:ubiquinone/menaquinone biosynthesis C-methylase UbiE
MSENIYMSTSHYNFFVEFAEKILDQRKITLDLGCGQGYLLKALHRNGFSSLIGVDFSVELLKEAKKNCGGQVHLIKADLHSLPFRCESIHQTLLCEVIEHVDCPEKAVRELKHVLYSQGRIALSFPNAYAFYPWYGFISKISERKRKNILKAIKPIALKMLMPYEDPARSLQPKDNPYTYFDVVDLFRGFNLVVRTGLYSGTRFRVEGLMNVLDTDFPPFYYRCFLGFSCTQK